MHPLSFSPSQADRFPCISKWTSLAFQPHPRLQEVFPATGKSSAPCRHPASQQPLLKGFFRNLMAMGSALCRSFCMFPGPELSSLTWSTNRIVLWLMALITAEMTFVLIFSKFFLNSALIWGLKVDHSALMKARCSKEGAFLKDCPVPVELYLIFFTCNKFLKASMNIKCIKVGWCPYSTQEATWSSGSEHGQPPWLHGHKSATSWRLAESSLYLSFLKMRMIIVTTLKDSCAN